LCGAGGSDNVVLYHWQCQTATSSEVKARAKEAW
jgi:hypothetical protein